MSREAAIATNRFGLGARPGEIESAAGNPRRWLLEQLEGRPATPAQFKGFPTTADHIQNYYYRYGVVSPDLKVLEDAAAASKTQAEIDKHATSRKGLLGGYVAWVREQLMLERAARTNVALTTPQPFRERMVRFWSNHLVVPVIKQPTAVLAGPYEREVIRPHTTGKFADMLLASARNPGMTYFLDNHLSAGPNSAYGQRHKIGLNENLGREILELHTLGVDGGYTQADVIALSKGITGWAFWPNAGRPENRDPKNAGRTPGAFNYFDEWHEPGPIVLMGKSYGQSGVAQGEAMLHDVARHPATARFLAGKLAAHFIGDDPPRAVVKRLAAVYLAHDTDLAEVCRALVEAPEAWAAAQSKLKQPEDYVLSGMRSLNLTLADNVVPAPSMYRFPGYRPPPASAGAPYSLAYDAAASMGQKPMGAPGPQGWYDRWADWSSADSLLKRVEWSLATATAHADRVEDPVRYLDQTLGGLASQDLRDSVKRAATKDQAIGLVLASPDFQRR